MSEYDMITHSCGWTGTAEDIYWYWEKSDMSDFGGYCPGCGKEWHDGRKLPENGKLTAEVEE